MHRTFLNVQKKIFNLAFLSSPNWGIFLRGKCSEDRNCVKDSWRSQDERQKHTTCYLLQWECILLPTEVHVLETRCPSMAMLKALGSLRGGAYYKLINSLLAELLEESNIVLQGSQNLRIRQFPQEWVFMRELVLCPVTVVCVWHNTFMHTPAIVNLSTLKHSPELGTYKHHALEVLELWVKSSSSSQLQVFYHQSTDWHTILFSNVQAIKILSELLPIDTYTYIHFSICYT